MYNNIKYKKIGGSIYTDKLPNSAASSGSSSASIPTYIKTEPNKEIFALSDIHGDIHSLIIVLRDLAQVIRKTGHPFDNNTYDADLERLLNINIADDDGDYIDTLNYEWIPGNSSYVVIIGDIIDAYRGGGFGMKKYHSDDYEHQYPQIEIKLLRFINALNKQAMHSNNNGRIFKLLGNHEVLNILSSNYQERYIFPTDLGISNYYRGETRRETFHYDNEGYKLLLEGECRCLLMLNNYIFVHGQIKGHNFDEFEEINNIINKSTNDVEIKSVYEYLDSPDNENSALWSRDYGEHQYIDDKDQQSFCSNVYSNLEIFVNKHHILKEYHIEYRKLKIVIGHCVQYTTSTNTLTPKKNTTFTNLESSSNNIRQITSSPSKSDYFNINNNLIFGITMDCHDHTRNNHTIFKVDIGSSRGFDTNAHYDNIFNSTNKIAAEKQFIYSRTPQVLKIKNNVEQIIKSTIKNTRIHQPRYYYEYIIEDEPFNELKLDSGNYLKKYLKYKKKYLELKKLYI
jgi:hypothetical protein